MATQTTVRGVGFILHPLGRFLMLTWEEGEAPTEDQAGEIALFAAHLTRPPGRTQHGLYTYREAMRLQSGDPDFYALIMAAMKKADAYNLQALRHAFPALWEELDARYNAPGGLLPGEEPPRLAPHEE